MTFLSLMLSVMLVMMGSVCLLSLLTVGLLACHHMSRVTYLARGAGGESEGVRVRGAEAAVSTVTDDGHH